MSQNLNVFISWGTCKDLWMNSKHSMSKSIHKNSDKISINTYSKFFWIMKIWFFLHQIAKYNFQRSETFLCKRILKFKIYENESRKTITKKLSEYLFLKCHEGTVRSFAFIDDTKTLISTSFDNKIKLWDLRWICNALGIFWIIRKESDYKFKIWKISSKECFRTILANQDDKFFMCSE